MGKKILYKAAVEELDKIVSDLQGGKIEIDELSNKVQRAKELFDFCQEHLKNIQKDIDDILISE